MYEPVYAAQRLHQEKARQVVTFAEQRRLLNQFGGRAAYRQPAGLLWRVSRWLRRLNEPTRVTTEVNCAPAH